VGSQGIVVKHLFADGDVTETVDGRAALSTGVAMGGSGYKEAKSEPTISQQPPPSRTIPANVLALSKVMEYPGDVVHLMSLSPYFVSTNEGLHPDRRWYNVNGRDMFGLTALHKACSWNKADIVGLLLKQDGIDLNQQVPATMQEFAGWSALHFCVDGASLGCLEALLSSTHASVDLQARNARNETALDLARLSTRQGGGYAVTCEAIIDRIEREDEKPNV
jgi:hypothetical protein